MERNGVNESVIIADNVEGSGTADIETNVITKPSIQTAMKIAKGLGFGVDDLMK